MPRIRPFLVPRPHLIERLEAGLDGKLSLISAPAGFGKTTLVASFVAACGLPAAWLSLDKDDNQVGRFLTYLLAALQAADPTIGREAAQLIRDARQLSTESMLTPLINDLDAPGGKLLLVLDDYQLISNPAVHEAVAFLLTHSPQRFHLLLAGRSDPPLPLARLRARGQLEEIRAAALRFSEAEAAQFLNDVMGLSLDAASIAALAARTEGWIAGLQMAALSMGDREDVRGFVERLSGTNRYILDYLLEEVLANQPSHIQHFLLRTSILRRLTAPLCDAVLADDARENGALESASILDYLERANVFLAPMDDRRLWYRYHHLFADLLQARLQQTPEKEALAGLHTRAAGWYEQNGLIDEAIYHASLTADNEWVERLIEQNYMEMFQRKDSASLRFWTGELSRELIYKRPRLSIHEAMSRSWLGELDEADRFLDEAEKRLAAGKHTGETETMLGHLIYVRSRVTAMRGDIGRTIELALAAREKTPANNQALLGGIGVMLGYAYFLDGDFPNAIQTLNETIQSGRAAGAINSTVGAYCVLARCYALQGQLHGAFEVYREAERFARTSEEQDRGALSIVHVGLAGVLYEWDELEAALSHVEQGLETIQLWGKADDIALAYVTLGRVQQARGKIASAVEAMESASQVTRTKGVFPEARHAVVTAGIRLHLAQGNGPAVRRWVTSLAPRLRSVESMCFGNELLGLTLARAYLAQGKPDAGLALLSRLDTNARSGGRTDRLIEILLLKALTMQRMGDTAAAALALGESLALAEPEEYRRVFLDEGQPMQALLAHWATQAGASPLRTYATRLLAQFAVGPPLTPAAAPGALLVEPLSRREREVLQIMALGKTNKEIASQLIIAPGTVKAHTASIYRKLDVANRTEAVARARQLGLLP